MVDILKNKSEILIIRLSSLGDILLTTPLVRSIKKQYPQITIDFLLKEQYQNTLRYNKNITNLYFYEKDRDKLKSNNYDLIIDLQNNIRSRNITRLLKRYALKFNKHDFDKFLLVHFKINKLQYLPQIPGRYANTIPNFNLDDDGLDLFLPNNFNSKLQDKKRYIGFAPGSKHFTKMWPIDYFIQLGKLLNQNGFEIILFGGSDDKQVCSQINDNLSFAINLCNNNDLFQTAIDIKKCSALICNDSGLMHVACAVQVPVLTIFGSTVKEFGFTPYKNQNLILENNLLTCRPCSHIGRNSCPKKHFKCMKNLTPEIAFDNLKDLLNDK